METKELAVVYICDDRYIWLLGISMISLMECNKDVNIYILGQDIQEDNKKKIFEIAEEHGVSCCLLNVPRRLQKEQLEGKRWPSVAFVRLFMAEILPDTVKRALYLDCDTLIKGEICLLKDWNMGGNLFCGVKDCVSRQYKKNIGLAEDDNYINGGVLLADIDALRKINVARRINHFFRKYFYAMSYPDQDVLNAVFKGRIGILPPEYNVMTIVFKWSYNELKLLRYPVDYYSEKEMKRAREYPVVVHFTQNLLTVRPWFQSSNHPLREEFKWYMDRSPWKNKVKDRVPVCGVRTLGMQVCMILPKAFALRAAGFFHGMWYPYLVYLKNKFLRRKISYDIY